MAIVALPLPIQLVNGNIADGGQVMTDLNAIASNVNANAAKNGTNSDITSLTALISVTGPTNFINVQISSSSFTNGTIVGSSIDGTTTGVTQAVGTNTNQLATMAALQQAVFLAVLPAQPGGNNIYDLYSHAGTAAWRILLNPTTYINANGL